jgi:predicted metal-dependent peptidase
MKSRNQKIANMAADYVINLTLKDFGFKVPEWVLCDEKFRNMTKDEVYQYLIDKLPPAKEQEQSDDGGDDKENGDKEQKVERWDIGSIKPYEGNKSERELESDMKRRIIEGVKALSKQKGEMPGFLKRLLDEFVQEPALSWEEELAPILREITEGTPTWENMDRRYIVHDIYLPGEKGQTGKAIVVIDSSGSTYRMVESFIGQVRHVLNQVDLKMTLVQCDTEVTEVIEDFDEEHAKNFELKGGGGTDFVPAFDLIENGSLEGDVILFFTDMYGSFPDFEPSKPVIWLDYQGSYPEKDVPFGRLIRMKR